MNENIDNQVADQGQLGAVPQGQNPETGYEYVEQTELQNPTGTAENAQNQAGQGNQSYNITPEQYNQLQNQLNKQQETIQSNNQVLGNLRKAILPEQEQQQDNRTVQQVINDSVESRIREIEMQKQVAKEAKGYGFPNGNSALVYFDAQLNNLASSPSLDPQTRANIAQVHNLYNSGDPVSALRLAKQISDGAGHKPPVNFNSSVNNPASAGQGKTYPYASESAFLQAVTAGEPKAVELVNKLRENGFNDNLKNSIFPTS